ncbi:MAG: ABC transporter ATP-binding protein [Anaerohalosphaera sp.]|nr:ABC transporter ATP-binding protein [Anaerohalosphaera sp.]
MLELIDVCKSYGVVGGQGSGAEVLRGVTARVEQGRSIAIVGPSGSGKSTLLNIIGGLDRATSGNVLHDGEDIGGLSDDKLSVLRNRRVGFVFQLHHLLVQCSVLENVLIPTLAGSCSKEDKERAREYVDELLERVGMAEFAGHRPGELSGGQRQRVAVVRALINEPSILLADEPTGSLDKAASDNVAELLVELNKEKNVTLIVATHSMELAERMGEVWRLNDGMI